MAATTEKESRRHLDFRQKITPHSMSTKFPFRLSASLFLVALIFAGCASPEPSAEVDFVNATINQKPAKLIMDTGSDSSLIFRPGRVGLEPAIDAHDLQVNAVSMDIFGESAPAHLVFGGQSLTAPLPVMDLPWFVRWVTVFMDSDGLISWPEVRDNILVFDAAKHVVRAVPELPPETASWLQLKVRRSGPLTLEIPLADGSTGTLLVDTGQPYGISLPPKSWRTWDEAHPDAPSTSQLIAFLGSDLTEVKDAWATEYQLGPLKLTDLPLHESLPTEWSGDPLHYSGTLGMYALTRLDFIVDAKNGVAYLHPKAPPGPSYPGLKRPNQPADLPDGNVKWTVDASVQIRGDDFWVSSASVKLNTKDYDGALADVRQAIAINPDNPAAYDGRSNAELCRGDSTAALADEDRAVALDPLAAGFYNDRGFVKFVRADWTGAIADLSQSLAIDPQDANALVTRGDTRQGRGDFLDALTDYEQAAVWQSGAWPDVAYASLHYELLRCQLGLPLADLAHTVATWKNGWEKSIGEYVAGRRTEAALLVAAAQDESGAPANPATAHEQQTAAEYYIGLVQLLKGDVSSARAHWQKCVAGALLNLNECTLARAELALTDPSTPISQQVLFAASKKYAAGDYAGAATDFSQAIAADSIHASAFYYRGLCRYNQGDHAGAIADLSQALTLDPKNFFAYENRGLAKDSSGDHPGAMADYAQAFSLNPQNATVDASDDYALESKGDYPGALAYHSKDIESDAKEDIPDDYAERAYVKEMQGDFAGALNDFGHAIALSPGGTPNSHVSQLLLQLRLSRVPSDLSKVAPKWKGDWLQALGQFAIGKLDDTALLAAARNSGELASPFQLCAAYYFIGLTHSVNGDPVGARGFWQKCLATNQIGEPFYLLARAELARSAANPKN